MKELWEWIVPDESDYFVEIAAPFWKEADNFFTDKANGPFCDNSDEIR